MLLFITFYLFRNILAMSDNPYLTYQMRNRSGKHKTTLILRSLSFSGFQNHNTIWSILWIYVQDSMTEMSLKSKFRHRSQYTNSVLLLVSQRQISIYLLLQFNPLNWYDWQSFVISWETPSTPTELPSHASHVTGTYLELSQLCLIAWKSPFILTAFF